MTSLLSPQDWELLWRLRNLGFPIPLLCQPMAPLQVHLDLGLGILLIYPAFSVTTVAIPLCLSAAETVKISQARLLINEQIIYTLAWEETEAATVRGYFSHSHRLLLPLYSASNGCPEIRLRKATPECGYLLLQGTACLPHVALGEVVMAELWLGDTVGRWSGTRFPILDFRAPELWEQWCCQRGSSFDFDTSFTWELPEE